MMKKIIALLVAAALLMLCLAGCSRKQTDTEKESEPSNNPSNSGVESKPEEEETPWDEPDSLALPLNQEVAGELAAFDSVNLYKLTVTEPGLFEPTFEAPMPSEGGTIGKYYINMYTRAEYRKDVHERTALLSLEVACWTGVVHDLCRFRMGAGDYFIEISGDHSAKPVCGYTIKTNFTSEAGKTDVEKEWNDTRDTATAISVGQKYTGNISRNDSLAYTDEDYYVFTLETEAIIHLQAEVIGFNNYIFSLYDADGVSFMRGQAYGGTEQNYERCTWKSFRLEAGTYYIGVAFEGASYGNSNVDYYFTVVEE